MGREHSTGAVRGDAQSRARAREITQAGRRDVDRRRPCPRCGSGGRRGQRQYGGGRHDREDRVDVASAHRLRPWRAGVLGRVLWEMSCAEPAGLVAVTTTRSRLPMS